jgi:hypothetical protein
MLLVKLRPALLLAILLYVALDLSLPAMPGAFVFDATDSVESTQTRPRLSVETVLLPAPVKDALVPAPPPRDDRRRLASAARAERERRPVPIRRSRPLHDPAPPSEDPH